MLVSYIYSFIAVDQNIAFLQPEAGNLVSRPTQYPYSVPQGIPPLPSEIDPWERNASHEVPNDNGSVRT